MMMVSLLLHLPKELDHPTHDHADHHDGCDTADDDEGNLLFSHVFVHRPSLTFDGKVTRCSALSFSDKNNINGQLTNNNINNAQLGNNNINGQLKNNNMDQLLELVIVPPSCPKPQSQTAAAVFCKFNSCPKPQS